MYSNKWVRRFLRLAKEAAESTNCESRNVGCVLVRNKVIISTGMNGPPPDCKNNSKRIELWATPEKPPNTDPYYDPKICKLIVLCDGSMKPWTNNPCYQSFLDDFEKGKAVCPRKLLGYRSGEKLEICNCNHAESNAISFAAREGNKTTETSCFTYPISPCKVCAGLLVSAGIKEIYSIHKYDDPLAEIILKEGGVKLFLVDPILLDLPPKDNRILTDTFVTQQ